MQLAVFGENRRSLHMAKQNYQITVTDNAIPAVRRVITAGVSQYNREMAGYCDAKNLSVLVMDSQSKKVVGGLLGRTSLGLFFIDLLFLPTPLRGNGIGAQVIEYAEAEAKERGCSTAVLYTITFQAPGFYERRGYRVLGRIECPSPGHTRLCMTKAL
jgi:GNAT superfamily N-acetyltransferase